MKHYISVNLGRPLKEKCFCITVIVGHFQSKVFTHCNCCWEPHWKQCSLLTHDICRWASLKARYFTYCSCYCGSLWNRSEPTYTLHLPLWASLKAEYLHNALAVARLCTVKHGSCTIELLLWITAWILSHVLRKTLCEHANGLWLARWLNEQSITKHWFQSIRTCPYSWTTGRNNGLPLLYSPWRSWLHRQRNVGSIRFYVHHAFKNFNAVEQGFSTFFLPLTPCQLPKINVTPVFLFNH